MRFTTLKRSSSRYLAQHPRPATEPFPTAGYIQDRSHLWYLVNGSQQGVKMWNCSLQYFKTCLVLQVPLLIVEGVKFNIFSMPQMTESLKPYLYGQTLNIGRVYLDLPRTHEIYNKPAYLFWKADEFNNGPDSFIPYYNRGQETWEEKPWTCTIVYPIWTKYVHGSWMMFDIWILHRNCYHYQVNKQIYHL